MYGKVGVFVRQGVFFVRWGGHFRTARWALSYGEVSIFVRRGRHFHVARWARVRGIEVVGVRGVVRVRRGGSGLIGTVSVKKCGTVSEKMREWFWRWRKS